MRNYDELKDAILKQIPANSQNSLQDESILQAVARELGIRNNLLEEQQLLTVFHDLMRTGILGRGHNINNIRAPFIHLTERGRKSILNWSRDPANEQGYLKYIQDTGILSDLTLEYLKEGLHTYNNDCPRASAVMIGCASEALVIELRDAMVSKLELAGKSVPAQLKDWRIKMVLDEIQKQLDTKKAAFPKELKETYEAHWLSFVHQIRMARNDAGHPSGMSAASEDTVYAALLIFPALLKLQIGLLTWVNASYS